LFCKQKKPLQQGFFLSSGVTFRYVIFAP
jgi:hypothetical protein